MPLTTTTIFSSTTLNSAQLISILETSDPTLTSTAFTLHHSIYRSTPTPAPQPATSQLQILQLSSRPNLSFLNTSTSLPDVDKVAVVAIPTDSDGDFRRLLREKFGPLWQGVKAGEMRATGSSLVIGMFQVVAADLMRDRGLYSGGAEYRGTLISVSVIDEEIATASHRSLIQEFCAEIGLDLSGDGDGEVWGDFATMQSEVELWCSVLRQHVSGTTTGRPPPALGIASPSTKSTQE